MCCGHRHAHTGMLCYPRTTSCSCLGAAFGRPCAAEQSEASIISPFLHPHHSLLVLLAYCCSSCPLHLHVNFRFSRDLVAWFGALGLAFVPRVPERPLGGSTCSGSERSPLVALYRDSPMHRLLIRYRVFQFSAFQPLTEAVGGTF